ncbi:MAG: hypothetical protein QY326_01355 [Bdellovibrionota bacterium]|nr:MAG: hypothetical protein QY326_01355 [Bdellovibrionota bacterium]
MRSVHQALHEVREVQQFDSVGEVAWPLVRSLTSALCGGAQIPTPAVALDYIHSAVGPAQHPDLALTIKDVLGAILEGREDLRRSLLERAADIRAVRHEDPRIMVEGLLLFCTHLSAQRSGDMKGFRPFLETTSTLILDTAIQCIAQHAFRQCERMRGLDDESKEPLRRRVADALALLNLAAENDLFQSSAELAKEHKARLDACLT